jgi:hypothetical protein
MDKNLSLIFKFKDAPAEVQQVAEIHYQASLKLAKVKGQISKWQAELKEAEIAFDASKKAYNSALNRWDAEGIEAEAPKEKNK